MKILFVTQGYYPAIGGTELLMQRLAEELVHQFADEVTVFTTNCYGGEGFYISSAPRMQTGWEEINGVRVRRFPVYSWISGLIRFFQRPSNILPLSLGQYIRLLASGPIIPGLSQAIQEWPFDVLAASSFPLMHMFIALRAAQKVHRPCVLNGGMHPLDHWGFDRPMIYQAVQQADHYIAYTQYEADYVIRKGAHASKVTTIGVGVDPEPFEQISAEEAKKHLGLDPETQLVGFVGQLGWHKGIDTLLKAMQLVWQVRPETMLLIAGAKTRLALDLERWLDQLSPEERSRIILRYNFKNEEKPLLFSALDIFAYPSGFESFGIAFLEAWSAKKPVIGCRSGAVPWVVSAGRDGLLVGFRDDKLLAQAILTLLENPAWASRLAEAGHDKVIQRYNWPEIARGFRKVYQNVTTRE
jgi:glycosyltransferase involved in cell wall biosynthesis